jgi:polyisoprenoid-binding protein YceI
LEGWFDADIQGGDSVNPAVPAQARLELPVSLLSSGNPLYDRELRRRIDARRYPVISGEMKLMQKVDGDHRYRVSGDISFRGVTRTYEDEMTLTAVDDHTIRLQGERTFDVRDFGMHPPKILSLKVYPDVTVKVDLVARRPTPRS